MFLHVLFIENIIFYFNEKFKEIYYLFFNNMYYNISEI